MRDLLIGLLFTALCYAVWNYYVSVRYIEELKSLEIPYVYDASKLDAYCWGEGWKKS